MTRLALALTAAFAATSYAGPATELGWESGTWDSGKTGSAAPVLSFQEFTDVKSRTQGELSKENSVVRYVKAVKAPWAKAGEHVLKVYGEPPAFRSEIGLMAKDYRFKNGSTMDFRASYRPDASWSKPSKYSIIITQWKLFGTPPMVALRLSNDGKRELTLLLNREFGEKKKRPRWSLGEMPADKWTDIRILFKWALDDTGLIKVWKNGKLLMEHKGKNMTKDAGGYAKLGMYTEINDPRVIYIDEVRVEND